MMACIVCGLFFTPSQKSLSYWYDKLPVWLFRLLNSFLLSWNGKYCHCLVFFIIVNFFLLLYKIYRDFFKKSITPTPIQNTMHRPLFVFLVKGVRKKKCLLDVCWQRFFWQPCCKPPTRGLEGWPTMAIRYPATFVSDKKSSRCENISI